MSSAKRAIGYIRFSTKEQGKEGKRSYDRQWEMIQTYASDHSLDLEAEPYLDFGISAFRASNKKASLGELLVKAQSGKIEKGSVIITESMDRLGREAPLDQIFFMKSLVETGVRLAVLDSGKLYNEHSLKDLMEVMFALMSAGRGHQESKEKSRRITDVWKDRRESAKEGIIKSGNLPSWLKRKDDRAVVIEERAKVIRSIFEMSAHKNMGIYAIRDFLNKNPQTPYWGSHKRAKKADVSIWRHSYIQRVLKDVSVMGWWQPFERLENNKRRPVGEVIKTAYPPILDEDLFNLAAHKMQSRFMGRKSGRMGKSFHNNLIRSIGKCVCGAVTKFEQKGMMRGKGNENLAQYKYLSCFEKCGRMPVNYFRAENLLFGCLSHADLEKVFLGEDEKRSDQMRENEQVRANIAQRQAKYDKLKGDYKEADEVKGAMFLELMAELKNEIYELKGKLVDVSPLPPSTGRFVHDELNEMMDAIQSGTAMMENRKKLYDYIVSVVEGITVRQWNKRTSGIAVEMKNGEVYYMAQRQKTPRSKEYDHFYQLVVDDEGVNKTGFMGDLDEWHEKVVSLVGEDDAWQYSDQIGMSIYVEYSHGDLDAMIIIGAGISRDI